ncbi:MAG: hypothetical protein A3K19_15365 [Lentisphaerae bacterium RIFOXYB12_FULL_65_16]|nr:MAG: hypothetical protein A3K18_29160 [Lentisphaerae bacterium RIFOXYA12_64_32]OGV88478.1 MAG: hypothetical protein A3K19_15365 [Lentisphaerae bacterium RIFOXYB12_FULL_65_16]
MGQPTNLGKLLTALAGLALAVAIVILAARLLRERNDDSDLARTADVPVAAAMPPQLETWRELSRIPLGMRSPRGIAVDRDRRLFVTGDTLIKVYSATGAPAAEFALDLPPQCLAVDRDGRMFVGLVDHVEVRDAAGARLSAWIPLGENAFITSVAVTDTDVFVADSGGRLVWRFDKTGKLLNRLGEKGSSPDVEGFILPSPHLDLALSPDNTLWVNNPGRLLVESYAADGRRLRSWGTPSMKPEGFCGCCNPISLAVAPDGSFVTAEKGIARVKRYSPDGAFRAVVAGPECFDPGTDNLDVAADAAGRILVLDPKRGMVLIFVAQ